MGVFDQDRNWTQSLKLQGNAEVASQWIKPALKIVEVLQGILDLGHNEGMRTAHYQLDTDTRLDVDIKPGVTNEIALIRITSTFPEVGEEEERIELPPFTQCPRLPLGRRGHRMFSEVLDFDVQDAGSSGFSAKTVAIVQTPYIEPTLAQGEYCSGGIEQKHGEISLEAPFTFAEGERTQMFIHFRTVGFFAPQVGLNIDQGIMARDAPCTIDPPGSPTSVPDIDSLFPGNSEVITMDGGSLECQSIFEDQAILVEGSANFGLSEMIAGDAEIISGKRQRLAALGESEEGIQSSAGASSAGEVRQFAIIAFRGSGGQEDVPAEIVLLYKSDLCPAAVGLFYSGLDGSFPTSLGTSTPSLATNPPCGGNWLGPQLCDDIICESNEPGSACTTPRCGVPNSTGGYLIGKDRKGLAWIQGNATSALLSKSAGHNLDSRAFWFELDSDGFPNGFGLHNGPQRQGSEVTSLQNSADLGFA